MAQYRAARLAQEIQRSVSEMLQFELRDPRLHMASITRVEVTNDLRYARVYVSAVTDAERDEAARVLQRARGRIRSVLARQFTLRIAPELHFIADAAIVGGDRVLGLLRDLEAREDHDTPASE